MKKILFVLISGILMSSCMSRCDEDETRFWGQYEYNRQYYEHYSDDIMKEVVRNSIFTLDYVLRLKETLNAPLTDGTYVIVDTNGVKAGPLECMISGRDTLWSISGKTFNIRQEGDFWKVTKTDGDAHKNYRYNFELTAEMTEEVGPGTVHHPWKISFEGERFEASDYTLGFRSEDMLVSWKYPGSFCNQEALCTGTLSLSFRCRGNVLDSMEATYLKDGSIKYVKSF